MEELLRGQTAAEIIPFDFSAPCLYFPIRHHSPACSWHLKKAIEEYRPDCILIEGPENADSLIPVLASEESKTPLARTTRVGLERRRALISATILLRPARRSMWR